MSCSDLAPKWATDTLPSNCVPLLTEALRCLKSPVRCKRTHGRCIDPVMVRALTCSRSSKATAVHSDGGQLAKKEGNRT